MIGSETYSLVDDDGFGMIQIAGIDDESFGTGMPSGSNRPIQKPGPQPFSDMRWQKTKIGQLGFIFIPVIQLHETRWITIMMQDVNMVLLVTQNFIKRFIRHRASFVPQPACTDLVVKEAIKRSGRALDSKNRKPAAWRFKCAPRWRPLHL